MKTRREVPEFSDSRLLLTRLRLAAHGDGADPKSFALLLSKAAATEAWRDEGFESLTDYVMAPEPRGLNMSVAQMWAAAKLAGPETVLLLKRLRFEEVDEAPDRPPGRPPKNVCTADIKGQPRHNTVDSVVARLKRDDPGLAEEVRSGEVSADAAARAKGWRKPRIVLAKQETVANALIEHMPRDALRYIADKIRDYLKED